MKLHKFENREIRSFRIREGALELKAFLDNNKRAACFIMSDSIQPQDRIDSREFLSKHDLHLSLLSKRVINLLMHQEQWVPIKELFKGNVIKIEPKGKATGEVAPFTSDKLQGIINRDVFSVRLFIENQKVYRENKLKNFLTRSSEDFKATIVKEKLKAPLSTGLYVLDFLQAKANYK